MAAEDSRKIWVENLLQSAREPQHRAALGPWNKICTDWCRFHSAENPLWVRPMRVCPKAMSTWWNYVCILALNTHVFCAKIRTTIPTIHFPLISIGTARRCSHGAYFCVSNVTSLLCTPHVFCRVLKKKKVPQIIFFFIVYNRKCSGRDFHAYSNVRENDTMST